jgi:hypothetical protein
MGQQKQVGNASFLNGCARAVAKEKTRILRHEILLICRVFSLSRQLCYGSSSRLFYFSQRLASLAFRKKTPLAGGHCGKYAAAVWPVKST